MATNNTYMAVGEEANRGTVESTTLGFIALKDTVIPEPVFEDKMRKEVRGEDTYKGAQVVQRMHQSWTATLAMNFFTEAGTTVGMMGTLLKHFFGHVSTAQQGATDAYGHMYSPVPDHYIGGSVGAKGLSLNLNLNEQNTMKNWPYVGGRPTTLSFDQEAKDHLVMGMDLMGQFRAASEAEVGSEVFPAENLRCDYNNLAVYTGTITRTGSAPNYTDITFGSGTVLYPDKVSIKMENGLEDITRLSGVDYPDLTRVASEFKVEVELTIDWRTTSFDSIAEFNAWVAAASSTNLAFVWDSGTEAGTAFNHKLVIDIPVAQRMGGLPEYDLEKDPMVTLKYEGIYSATTLYKAGIFLQNTATAV